MTSIAKKHSWGGPVVKGFLQQSRYWLLWKLLSGNKAYHDTIDSLHYSILWLAYNPNRCTNALYRVLWPRKCIWLNSRLSPSSISQLRVQVTQGNLQFETGSKSLVCPNEQQASRAWFYGVSIGLLLFIHTSNNLTYIFWFMIDVLINGSSVSTIGELLRSLHMTLPSRM